MSTELAGSQAPCAGRKDRAVEALGDRRACSGEDVAENGDTDGDVDLPVHVRSAFVIGQGHSTELLGDGGKRSLYPVVDSMPRVDIRDFLAVPARGHEDVADGARAESPGVVATHPRTGENQRGSGVVARVGEPLEDPLSRSGDDTLRHDIGLGHNGFQPVGVVTRTRLLTYSAPVAIWTSADPALG